ncbi:MAG: A/G-specific adenine glycosylase [Flavobacteriaceae bacterium]
MIFSQNIINWYSSNKRDLPWRRDRNPYSVWLSEIILQQTRIEQGTPYYYKFIENFPEVTDLADAEEEEVLKLWQGLGYYSRARNLHVTAQDIRDNYGGQFPDNYKELKKLKGVGDYTASAISSICFDEVQAVLDGNVFRVLSRYFGVDLPINSSEGIKFFRQKAQSLAPSIGIGDYNQGLMDLGSRVCSPKKPTCEQCPLSKDCVAYLTNSQLDYPVKKGKVKVKEVYFYYLVIASDNGLMFRKRLEGIWKNMYEFPYISSDSPISDLELVRRVEAKYDIQIDNNGLTQIKEEVVHKLSHMKINGGFYALTNAELPYKLYSYKEVEKLPVPVIISNFLKEYTVQ